MSYNQFKFRVSLDNVDAYELTGADRTAEIDVQALADSTLDVDNVSNVISGFGNANRAPYAKPFGAIKFTASRVLSLQATERTMPFPWRCSSKSTGRNIPRTLTSVRQRP